MKTTCVPYKTLRTPLKGAKTHLIMSFGEVCESSLDIKVSRYTWHDAYGERISFPEHADTFSQVYFERG